MDKFIRNTSLINGGSGETDSGEDNGAEIKLEGNHGNTRLPFGLCERFGIALPKNATPRDAWNALKGEIGITPQKAYDDLKDNGEPIQMKKENSLIPKDPQISGEIDYQAEKGKMLADENRVIYSKHWTQERLSQVLDYGTEEMSGLTSKLFNDDSFGFRDNERDTAFYPGFNKVCILKNDDGGDGTDYSKGGTFYHEMWHAIDYNYGSCGNLSTSIMLSSGKTFKETLEEETMKVNWKAVKEELEIERRNDSIKRFGFDREEIISNYEELNKKKWKIWDEAGKGINDFEEAYKAQTDATKKFCESEEYKKAAEMYNRVKEEDKYSGSVKQRWGDLSDIYDGYKMGREDLCYMNHGKSYWKNRPNGRAHEAFAECASAMATNPESFKVLQKYCPKTVAAFEEIVLKLKKGEIKSNGKPKYQR